MNLLANTFGPITQTTFNTIIIAGSVPSLTFDDTTTGDDDWVLYAESDNFYIQHMSTANIVLYGTGNIGFSHNVIITGSLYLNAGTTTSTATIVLRGDTPSISFINEAALIPTEYNISTVTNNLFVTFEGNEVIDIINGVLLILKTQVQCSSSFTANGGTFGSIDIISAAPEITIASNIPGEDNWKFEFDASNNLQINRYYATAPGVPVTKITWNDLGLVSTDTYSGTDISVNGIYRTTLPSTFSGTAFYIDGITNQSTNFNGPQTLFLAEKMASSTANYPDYAGSLSLIGLNAAYSPDYIWSSNVGGQNYGLFALSLFNDNIHHDGSGFSPGDGINMSYMGYDTNLNISDNFLDTTAASRNDTGSVIGFRFTNSYAVTLASNNNTFVAYVSGITNSNTFGIFSPVTSSLTADLIGFNVQNLASAYSNGQQTVNVTGLTISNINEFSGGRSIGILTSQITGGSRQYILLDATNSDFSFLKDNYKILIGAAEDSSLYYNGTDLVVNPKEVGSGKLLVTGSLYAGGDVTGTGTIEGPKLKITPEGGMAILLKNGTGATSTVGLIVRCSTIDDTYVTSTAGGYMPIGAVYNAVGTSSYGWIAVSGRVQVLLDATLRATAGNWAGVSNLTAGRADCSVVGPSLPTATTHSQEIGHCLQSVGSGQLCFINMHFN